MSYGLSEYGEYLLFIHLDRFEHPEGKNNWLPGNTRDVFKKEKWVRGMESRLLTQPDKY